MIAIISPGLCIADTPAFDRPGIAFSTQTLPPRSMGWEQGLPDVVHTNQDGSESTLYSANTRVRIGLTATLELQLAEAIYNKQFDMQDGVRNESHGYGDPSFAIKMALPSIKDFSWALLGGVTLNVGNQPFRNDTRQYQIASSGSLHVSDSSALGVYASVLRTGNLDSYTVSPNFSWALRSDLSAYVEAGYTFGKDIDKDEVVGGGLAWMITKTVQLDAYGLHGVTAQSTKWQAGMGVSKFFQ